MNATRIRIMIVDDHPVVRAGLASMLSTQPGIDVVGSAASGVEALALLKTITPDVILMDLRMSGMSGLETIRAINLRTDPPRNDPRFQKLAASAAPKKWYRGACAKRLS